MSKARHQYFVAPDDPDTFYILPEKDKNSRGRLARLGWQPTTRNWVRRVLGEKAFDNHMLSIGVGQFYWTGNRVQPHGRGVLEEPS